MRIEGCLQHTITYFLVEFNVFHNLKCQREVTEQDVHSEKPNNAKVAKHSVERPLTVLPDDITVEASRFEQHEDELSRT